MPNSVLVLRKSSGHFSYSPANGRIFSLPQFTDSTTQNTIDFVSKSTKIRFPHSVYTVIQRSFWSHIGRTREEYLIDVLAHQLNVLIIHSLQLFSYKYVHLYRITQCRAHYNEVPLFGRLGCGSLLGPSNCTHRDSASIPRQSFDSQLFCGASRLQISCFGQGLACRSCVENVNSRHFQKVERFCRARLDGTGEEHSRCSKSCQFCTRE